MKNLAKLLLVGFMSSMAHAQVTVSMALDRPTYLVNEPVTAVVTITNRSGSELFLHSEMKGKIARSWLEFSMRHSGGDALPRMNHGAFRAAKLGAGQTISRRINLSQLYSVAKQGNFSANARIQINDQVFTSNSSHFTVSEGSLCFKQPFGAPKTKFPNREYRVITFNDGKTTSIYAAVHEAKTQRALATGRISKVLLFKKPQATLDSTNNLHVLYLSNPEVFVHAIVNKNGQLASTKYFKRGASGTPSLAAQRDGMILVQGGIPFDPKKEAAERDRARKVSERPGQ
ncbi:MAG: hypothetical protein OSA93_03660 [Akkermansiaceae bacterium]|nr:hypothetical protein [Akkermansiaceae bacterium]